MAARIWSITLVATLVGMYGGPAALAAPSAQSGMLKVGDRAPDFVLPESAGTTANGDALRLSDFRGTRVLLAFYPKAFSPGCVKQFTEYRKDIEVFRSNDTEIIAVSADRQKQARHFREEYDFPFTVVGDPDRSIIQAYEVPQKEYVGVTYPQRAVFLIDEAGIIKYIEMDYSVVNGKTELYERLRDLSRRHQTKASDEDCTLEDPNEDCL